MAEVLKGVYENIGEAGSLSSPTTLSKVTGVRTKSVQDYLQNEPSYTLHRNHRLRANQYRKTKAFYPLDIMQADLLTLDELQRRHNTPYKYILLAISVFSRYAYAIPLRSKRGVEVAQAIESILEKDSYKKIQTDRGSEFVNPHVAKVLEKYSTLLYHSHSPIKAALAERLIRTIRLLISRYCTLKNTPAFIHDLDKIMLIYNQRPHRSLSNSTPTEVHHSDHDTIDTFLKQYSNESKVKKKKNKFNVGDTVRINRTTNVFEKGNYLWSTELFKVAKILDTKPITYRLRDTKDEEILGGFYDYELQKVKNASEIYQIEKILKTRTRGGKKQLLVRWLGYNSDFDSWIGVEDIDNAQ